MAAPNPAHYSRLRLGAMTKKKKKKCIRPAPTFGQWWGAGPAHAWIGQVSGSSKTSEESGGANEDRRN